ncbi:MAG: tetratricopeptide repeat protein [bacterium]|nr:tetratricopeptide repeat protein [bacterium]
MTGRRTPMRVRAAFLIVAWLGLLSLVACSPDAAEHRARAEQYLAEDKPKEALLELRSALQIEPKEPETNFRIAAIADDLGMLEDAVFYYKETYRIDPTRSDAALAEARLVAWEEPERADELIQGVLERDPANALARVRLSELALTRDDAAGAFEAAMVAVELAPDDYRAHMQLGIVRRAQVREFRTVGDTPEAALFEQALTAFDRALELSESAKPDEVLQIRLDRAMVFVSWEGHESEAVAAYRETVEATKGSLQRSALDAAFSYARRTGNVEFRRWVLEYQRTNYPEAYAAWGELARLEDESGGSGVEILKSLIELQPESAQAHLLYARHMAEAGQRDEGAVHLLEVADRVDEPALVLASAVSMKLLAGEPEDAKAALARLETEYPDLPATHLARAQRAFVAGRFDEAAEILDGLTVRAPSRRVSELLARVEQRRRAFPAALAAVEQALELVEENTPPVELLRIKAQIQAAMGDWQGTRRTLRRMMSQAKTGLRLDDRVLLARSLYELQRPARGKQILERLIVLTPPPVEALIEFGRRERGREPERARALLELARESAPNDLRPIALLARLDVETGNPEAAWTSLEAAVEGNPPSPRLHLLRARLLASQGDLEAALLDTRRALEIKPDFAAASRFQMELLSAQGKVGEGIEALEALAAEGHLDASGRVRLARMHSTLGNDDRAVELLEQALAEQEDLYEGMNDLAFLLASRGVELSRAVQLAQEARSALPDSPDVADTLGFAYLRNGLPEAALPQFESAIELAEASGQGNPLLLYHLGLALQALERNSEAATALEGSLAIEGEFPGFPREEAQRELQALRSAEAGGGSS